MLNCVPFFLCQGYCYLEKHNGLIKHRCVTHMKNITVKLCMCIKMR